MGDYSLEPPRKTLYLHHTYDAIDPELDRVLDTGPQGHDGNIIGSVETRVPGIDGDAVRVVGDKDSHVSINAQPGTMDAITLTTWINFEEAVAPTADNVKWELELNGSFKQLTWQFPNDFTGWHYFVGWYDGSAMRIYHGTPGSQPEQVASQSESGTVDNDFVLEVDMSFKARVDDTRVYKTDLTTDQIDDIWRMAAQHTVSDEIGNIWPTRGLDYEKGKGNARLAGSLGEKTEWIERTLDQIREARHIDDAAGKQLDRIGQLLGVRRQSGEQDPQYKARIKAEAIAGRSSGTFRDILDGMAAILETEKQRIELKRDDAAIATAEITVQSVDVDDAPITISDLKDAAKDMVLAGHAVNVVESQKNAFTLIADGGTNDADKGLTSDSITTGGTLVEDL